MQKATSTTVLASLLVMVAAIGLSQLLVGTVVGKTGSGVEHTGYDPRTDAPEIYATGLNCDSWYHDAKVWPCESGNSRAKRTVVLLGDSIGAQWAPLLPEVFSSPDWKIMIFTKSSCAIADVEYFYEPAGGMYEVCTQWRNASIDYIEELKPDIVFIGSSAAYDFSESQWVGGSERVVSKLAPATQHLVVIPGNPELSFDGPSCIEEPYRFAGRLRDSLYICEEAQTNSISNDVADYLVRAASGYSNVNILNLNDLICPNGRCAARTSDGLAVFRDHQHLTASFVRAQAPEVSNRLNAMGVDRSSQTDSSSTQNFP